MPTTHALGLSGALLLLAVSVSACSDDSDDPGGASGPVTVDIVEKDGEIQPSGDVVDVERGQDIQLVVTSDVADEIHVHSTPEHEFEIEAGADAERLDPFAIDTPGTIEVESHGLEVVIVKLQVS